MLAIKNEVQSIWELWRHDPDKFHDRMEQKEALKRWSESEESTTRLLYHTRTIAAWGPDFVLKSDGQKQLYIDHETTPVWVLDVLSTPAIRRWQSLFDAPDDWYDLRSDRQSEPDFQHKVDGHELRLDNRPHTAWVKGQLRLLELWRSFFDKPALWSVERDHQQDPTGYLVHNQHSRQLNIDDAPTWAKAKFELWIETDRAERQVILHKIRCHNCIGVFSIYLAWQLQSVCRE